MTDNSEFSGDIPDRSMIERLRAGRPDATRFLAILSRSYEYIRNLPLKGKGSSQTIREKIRSWL